MRRLVSILYTCAAIVACSSVLAQSSAPRQPSTGVGFGWEPLPSPSPGAEAGAAEARRASGEADPRASTAERAEPAQPSAGVINGDGARGTRRVEGEFERYVREATGHRLPLFGQRYFDAPAGVVFNPIATVPVPADYVIGPGDELLIRVWGAVEFDHRGTVDRDGMVHLPRVGSVVVAGVRATDLAARLQREIGRIYRNFELSVTLGQLRGIQVFVVGQALVPGSHTIGALSTLVNAVFATAGPTANGSLRRIQLKRGGQLVAELDLYAFLVDGDKRADVRLLAGDVIVYPPAGPRVALYGAIDNPAIYELRPEGEALQQLLRYAGGLGAATARHRVQFERIDPARPAAPRAVEQAALDDAGLARGLRDGDLVALFPVGAQIANAVTLRGNVAEPLRHPFRPGMRVSDLIPNREALITPESHRRRNRLVQYAPPGAEAGPTGQELTSSTRELLDEPNWEYAVIERVDPARLTTDLVPFHLGRAVARDAAADLPLRPGDIVTIYGRKDLLTPQAVSTRLVRVEGEVRRPGVYQLEPGESLQRLLERAGGFTPEAYVFGLEFSRERTRARQREAIADAVRRLEATLQSSGAQQLANLSGTDAETAARLRAAQEEARRAQLNRLRGVQPNGRIALEVLPEAARTADLPDLPLEDGDRIVVPSRPGFVYAVGAVANNNAIVWRAGRRLSDYLRAAGVEPSADDDNLFVVRADGSVVHSRDYGTFLNRIGDLALAPGDTVVVPERLDRESRWSAFVRGLKDWTQILYQFGLTAAAIHTLR